MIYKSIEKYLTTKGIKQSFLSEKTGISEQILSAMLNGKRTIKVDEYFKICEALGISLDYLRGQFNGE
jgi:transcriptional regulator with XRE-family HTH domain